MRFLVTGAGGLLGTELVRYLRQQNEEVVAWDLPGHDVTDVEKTIADIHRVGPAVIFHLAAWTDVDGCEADPGRAGAVNFQGAWAVALGATELGARMVYLSTDYVFDGKAGRPYAETDTPNPISVYGRTKLLGEKAVMRSCGKYLIVRTSGLYGRHGRNFVDTIRQLSRTRISRQGHQDTERGVRSQQPEDRGAEAGNTQGDKDTTKRKLPVVSDQTCSPTYAPDLCAPLFELVKTGQQGVFHLTNSGQCAWFELARMVVQLAGGDCEVVPIAAAELGRSAPRPAFSVLENRHFRKKFGRVLRPWQEALADYLKDEGPDRAQTAEARG